MKKYLILAAVVVIVIIAAAISKTGETSKTEFLLDTVGKITVKGNYAEDVDKAFERIKEIEGRMSSHISTSDVVTGTLNIDTAYVISKGLGYGKISDGLFDITIKPVCKLWDIGGENQRIPAQEEIDSVLPLVNYKKVSFSKDNVVMEQGMELELGAIAKGYAADEACRILKEAGVKDGIIDLGGNVVALGSKTVGIKNPLSANSGDYFGILRITDCAVATSGGYERFFEQDGVRYHHIFDPATGYPVKTDVLSATVVSSKSIDADCWSTILFSACMEKAKEYIAEHNLNAVLVDVNNNVYTFGNIDFTIDDDCGMNHIK